MRRKCFFSARERSEGEEKGKEEKGKGGERERRNGRGIWKWSCTMSTMSIITMSGRCVVEDNSGGKISPVSRAKKKKTKSFPRLRISLDTRGFRVWRNLEQGRLTAFVSRPSGSSLMKGAVAGQFSFLPLDQTSSKYFCKHPKFRLCCRRYLPCKSETLQAFNTFRGVQVCPQREHALSISEFPHRRKLSGVGVVFAIACKEKRSWPSLIPNISQRKVRSECITSVHSKNFPWILVS